MRKAQREKHTSMLRLAARRGDGARREPSCAVAPRPEPRISGELSPFVQIIAPALQIQRRRRCIRMKAAVIIEALEGEANDEAV